MDAIEIVGLLSGHGLGAVSSTDGALLRCYHPSLLPAYVLYEYHVKTNVWVVADWANP